ncbi:hypothetical protein C8Q72DRAFT_290322 [Fomitopsis betulina]|nr:hypothetical protein C8Q72DRAFT_290322 [Fomitopsis betulina]
MHALLLLSVVALMSMLPAALVVRLFRTCTGPDTGDSAHLISRDKTDPSGHPSVGKAGSICQDDSKRRPDSVWGVPSRRRCVGNRSAKLENTYIAMRDLRSRAPLRQHVSTRKSYARSNFQDGASDLPPPTYDTTSKIGTHLPPTRCHPTNCITVSVNDVRTNSSIA